jgi:hypothetical protein
MKQATRRSFRPSLFRRSVDATSAARASAAIATAALLLARTSVAADGDTRPAAPTPAPAAGSASAGDATPAPPSLAAPEPPADEPSRPEDLDPFTRIAELEAQLEQTRSLVLGRQPRVTVGGYIDLGFFVPQGDGSGIIRDQGNVLFPQYAGQFGWVFLGDILSTAVNSRGEVADLSDATGAVPRFDSVHSGGAPGFIERKSNQRFGITPSLIARYTTGTALGVKIRSKFGPDDLFVVAAAVTNGSFTQEQFHFYDEIDQNLGKTASGRLSLHPPIPVDMELGISGSYGPQDRSPNSDGKMWFYGVDYQFHVSHADLKAQFLKGAAPGDPLNQVYGLKLHGGGYVELDYMILPYFGLLARGEYRDAFVWLGTDRAYLTKSWRATGGVHVNFSDRIVLKAEYLRNGEYANIPQIKNDVFTTSLVIMN